MNDILIITVDATLHKRHACTKVWSNLVLEFVFMS